MSAACTVSQGDFRGWSAYHLDNGLVHLAAVPDIGGRLMAYDLGDHPYLFVDPNLAGRLFSPEENQGDGSLAAWKNYGGDKTWPSPQGWENAEQWPGPPDPILDTGRYTVTGCGAGDDGAWIEMRSPTGSSTGVQITRKATLKPGAARVQLDLSFLNISDRPRRWSIWDVIQLDAGKDGSPDTSCVMTAPLNPDSRFEQGFWVMFGAQDNPQWRADRDKGLFVGQHMWQIGKIGCDSQGGWIAFSKASTGHGFVGRFTVFPGQEYPDQGSTIECWTVGKGQVGNLDYENSGIFLMEAELLSPFYVIQPGEQARFTIEWAACRSAGMIVDVSAGAAFSEPVTLTPSGRSLKVHGAFGVFDQGQLSLTWLDANGAALAQQTLQPVDPAKLARLNLTAHPPARAAQMELAVIDQMGNKHQITQIPLH